MHVTALLNSAKALYNAHNYVQNRKQSISGIGDDGKKKGQSKHHLLSADDFLPIHIFAVAQAELRNPFFQKELMWALCNPALLNGEGGYYLTVFEAALQYILDIPADNMHPEYTGNATMPGMEP